MDTWEGRWAAPQKCHFQDHVIGVTGSNPAPHLLAAERERYIYIQRETLLHPPTTPTDPSTQEHHYIFLHYLGPTHCLAQGGCPTGPGSHHLSEKPPTAGIPTTSPVHKPPTGKKSHQLSGLLTTPSPQATNCQEGGRVNSGLGWPNGPPDPHPTRRTPAPMVRVGKAPLQRPVRHEDSY